MKKFDIKNMTLREKIGQTAVYRHLHSQNFKTIEEMKEYFSNNPYGATWPMAHTKEFYKVTETYLGNPELKGRKDDMFINYLNLLNEFMSVPMISAVDAARGMAPATMENHGELPYALQLGAADSVELAYEYGKAIGQDVRSAGFSWLWSPVCDNGGVYYDSRSLSFDHDRNCELLAAFVKGVQSQGVAACAKHFPGADPYEYRDPHFCSAAYAQSVEYWKNTQMKEFMACIDAGVESIMVGHYTFRAYDDTVVNGNYLPCSLSKKVITDLIKGEMGFKGVVFIDDASMKGLTAIYPLKKLYVELLKAGNDMVLGPITLDYIDVIEEAVLNGELPESRIDDACQRVLNLKEKYGVFDGPFPHMSIEERTAILDNMHNVADTIARKGLTLVRNTTAFLPLKKENIKKVKLVYIGYSKPCEDNLIYIKEEFARHGADCEIQIDFAREDIDTLDNYDLIIYGTYIGFHAPAGGPFFFGEKCHMMRSVMTVATQKSIGVAFSNPDVYFNYFTAAHTFINCYSYNRETMENFVKGLYGEIQFTKNTPFPLNRITRNNEL